MSWAVILEFHFAIAVEKWRYKRSQSHDLTHNPTDSEHQDYTHLPQIYVEAHLHIQPSEAVITGSSPGDVSKTVDETVDDKWFCLVPENFCPTSSLKRSNFICTTEDQLIPLLVTCTAVNIYARTLNRSLPRILLANMYYYRLQIHLPHWPCHENHPFDTVEGQTSPPLLVSNISSKRYRVCYFLSTYQWYNTRLMIRIELLCYYYINMDHNIEFLEYFTINIIIFKFHSY